MTDIAIRVENLSKLYPSTPLRTGHIGKAQKRHDTLRDALVDSLRGLSSIVLRQSDGDEGRTTDDESIWALHDVSFEVTRGEVVGIPSSFDFSQDARDRHWAQRRGEKHACFVLRLRSGCSAHGSKSSRASPSRPKGARLLTGA